MMRNMDFRPPTRRQFQSKSINSFNEVKKSGKSSPLWIWAVLVGAIILAKFTLRWPRLKRLAREARKR
jgi:hypothetical protein